MSRYGLEIRSASAADASGLAELFQSAGRQVEAAALSGRIDAVRRAGGAVMLALEWGPPSGVVAFTPHPTLDRDALIAQISMILVAPDARRRGIARMLIKAASQAARQSGCDHIAVAVGGKEEALQRFCMATGFEEAGGLYARSLRRRS